MKIHRFIGNFDIKLGEYLLWEKELIHQIWDVLKLRPGEKIVLCDGNLNDGVAAIVQRNDAGILVNIESIAINSNESNKEVVLYCSILKNENFELVCQKATEVGAAAIVPVVTERTIKLNLRYDRLNKIIKEAAELSARGRVPTLKEAMSLEKAITDAARFSSKTCFDVSGSKLGAASQGSTAVFIGPEGGWSNMELDQFKNNSFNIMTLGQRILRAETAAIVGTYLAAQ